MATPPRPFPAFKTRIFLILWHIAWVLLMPVILIYLKRRAKQEPMYFHYLHERFGFHVKRPTPHVWIHAVSLGEVRSATYLINQLLARGENVVITHFTPAGRSETLRLYPEAVANGRVVPVWVPFDYDLAYRRFFHAFRPKFGLVMEVEFWPGMIMSSRKRGVPLFLCNGQYPSKSYERDKTRRFSIADIVPGFAGVLVKSEMMAQPFREIGLQNIAVTGELRFDQPINVGHQRAGQVARGQIAPNRRVIVFASTVMGEDQIYIDALRKLQRQDNPLIVYVPRKPEHVQTAQDLLTAAGFSVQRRSCVYAPELVQKGGFNSDILLGDSLGEMHFYLAMADLVVVGGGFATQGSHNIIEPLLHGKPVILGPNIWTIEFPAREAFAAGVCRVATPDSLFDVLNDHKVWPDPKDFVHSMQGGAVRSLDAVDRFLGQSRA